MIVNLISVYRFIKTGEIWGLVIETFEQLKGYAKVVAYPKSCLVVQRLDERNKYNIQQVENGNYPLFGHFLDRLEYLADLEIQKDENTNMTVLEMKIFITKIMVDQKEKMIDDGKVVLTYGFSYKEFTSDIKFSEERFLDEIPVEFVKAHETEDYSGILFNVK